MSSDLGAILAYFLSFLKEFSNDGVAVTIPNTPTGDVLPQRLISHADDCFEGENCWPQSLVLLSDHT